MKETVAKLRLGQRFKLHSSNDDESRALFKSTSGHNSAVDGFIKSNTCRTTAVKEQSKEYSRSSFSHIISLKSQGKIIAAIIEHLNRSAITRWAKEIDKLAGLLFNFARKALIQQLPTAANLFRWGKATDPLCPLCKTCSQTNKHVISNCSSPVALERYKWTHDDVLTILVDAIIHGSKPSLKIFADLNDPQYTQLSSLFNYLRPDIAILWENSSFLVRGWRRLDHEASPRLGHPFGTACQLKSPTRHSTFQPSKSDSKHFYSNSLSRTNRDITPAARAPLRWPCYKETLYKCPIHYITLLGQNSVDTLELTICHETNLEKSKQYKASKYVNLQADIKTDYSNLKINRFTIEVTSLGLISDISDFCRNNLTNPLAMCWAKLPILLSRTLS